jgi:tetrahydromethanopterin S-methyltransferase subunit G
VLAGLEKKLDERLLEKMGDLTKRLDDIEQRDDFHKSAHEAQAVLRDNERALEALKKARLNNLPEFGKVQKRIDELQRRIFARVRYAEETGIAVPRHHPDSVALAEMQELRGEIIAEVHGTVQWLTDEVSILRLEMDEAGYTAYIRDGVDSWAKASNKKADEGRS